MRWASALSLRGETRAAIQEAAAVVRGQLDRVADLTVVFASAHHSRQYPRLPEWLREELGETLVIGCSAGGVIGAGREVEGEAGLSLTAAVLPGVSLHAFHLDASSLPSPEDSGAWKQRIGASAASAASLLLLPEPFSCPAEPILRGLDRAMDGRTIVGGLASGARQPGGNALFLADRTLDSGAVGVALSGNIEVVSIVAQGCRPIGQPLFVTRCQENVIWELDGRPALDVLTEIFQSLPRADQDLARHSLFLGVVMSPLKSEYRHGDFLIRNIIGMDPERRVLAIGAALSENDVVQFHLRDARTSAHDLDEMLGHHAPPTPDSAPRGALLFSCLGRGVHLYGEADHDSLAFRRHLGDVPLGGFFCNGEIGPVHGTTFLHGYTSSFALFRPGNP